MPDIFDQLDTPPARSGGDVLDRVASQATDIFDELPTGNRVADMGRRVMEGVSTGATHVDNAGDSVHDNDTFGGYTIAQLFQAAINYGLLA